MQVVEDVRVRAFARARARACGRARADLVALRCVVRILARLRRRAPLTRKRACSCCFCRPIYYDYTHNKYRADSFFESGNSNPLTTLFNFTSIWVNESLSMITYADPRSLQPESCIVLNLGIGMMRPDWMVAPVSSCMGDIWVTAKSAGFDEDYHRAVWTRINALPGDEGNFDW
jgi:hypothetical protein